VKEELKVMRDERTNKESAYRMMQRETKKVDALQKELNKMKENKVNRCIAFSQQRSNASLIL
jgi:hypothetical protein